MNMVMEGIRYTQECFVTANVIITNISVLPINI